MKRLAFIAAEHVFVKEKSEQQRLKTRQSKNSCLQLYILVLGV